MQASSSFYDGVVHGYAPSLPEIMLGIGGVAIAAAMVVLAIKLWRFVPESLDDRSVSNLDDRALPAGLAAV
jgi:Ni/Fe-hydrogenase subunit HybB-like protein